MPDPIIPAPSTAAEPACQRAPSGRSLPDLIAWVPKKKVEIAALASLLAIRPMKRRVSTRSAASKLIRIEFTATSRIFSGAGSSPRVFLNSIAEETWITCRTRGCSASPPG